MFTRTTSRSVAAAVVLLALGTPAWSGGLSFLGSTRDGVAGADGLAGGVGVAVSPDGAHVYVVGSDDDAVAVLARNGATGALTFVAQARDGIGGVTGMRVPTAVAVSPDGAHVYVTSREDDGVVVFARAGGAGTLTPAAVVRDGVGGVDGLDHASSVAVSPDGASVYVTGAHDDAVAAFARDAGTGALTFVGLARDGVGGVSGIARPTAVAVSPDGASVYVAGGAADGVGVFARDPGTGALTFVAAAFYSDGGRGVDRPQSLVVAPDGLDVYVAGHDDDGIVTLRRDPADGTLAFAGIVRASGVLGGLRGAFAVAATPDGRYVFGAAENDHTVSTLRRDVANGALRFVEVQRDGRLGVDGLRGAGAVAVSPDGAHLYAVGHEDDAVAAFAIDACGNGNTGADEQCDDGNLAAGDGCSPACRLELCGAVPVGGCRSPTVPGAALLTMTRTDASERHAFAWRWIKGEATPRADFGAPAVDAAYVVCVYDASAAPQPLAAMAAPAAGTCVGTPCWKPDGTGFVYKDRARNPDGLATMHLHEGLTDGTARVTVAGRGASLALPVLPLVPPVVVQVLNTATGACWASTHPTPVVNDGERFKAASE